MNYRVLWQRVGPFFTGLLIGALAWTPAFAATATSKLGDRWQPYLLIGSLILLAIALGLKAIGTGKPPRPELIDQPRDLRDAQQFDAIDVPLHQ